MSDSSPCPHFLFLLASLLAGEPGSPNPDLTDLFICRAPGALPQHRLPCTLLKKNTATADSTQPCFGALLSWLRYVNLQN